MPALLVWVHIAVFHIDEYVRVRSLSSVGGCMDRHYAAKVSAAHAGLKETKLVICWVFVDDRSETSDEAELWQQMLVCYHDQANEDL